MNEKTFRNAQDMTRLEPGRLERPQGLELSEAVSAEAPFIWRPASDAPDPRDLVLEGVSEHFMSRPHPGWRVLEIGGGQCDFALRLGSRVGTNRITIMSTNSEALDRAAACGFRAHEGGVPRLPCSDNNFDVIVALWSLTYVSDLGAALGDVHRVLRPGGKFLVYAAGQGHLADLVAETGGIDQDSLTAENGLDALGQHFTRITRTHVDTRAVFEHWQRAHDYLARFDPEVAARLPRYEGAREYAGSSTLFSCSSTNNPVPPVGEGSRRQPLSRGSRPMRQPTGINHPGLTPAGLPPPGTRADEVLRNPAPPRRTSVTGAGSGLDPAEPPNGMDSLDFAGPPEIDR
ncbi:MAG: class I SAM-dependent methyltransferase [Nocardioides sp.]